MAVAQALRHGGIGCLGIFDPHCYDRAGRSGAVFPSASAKEGSMPWYHYVAWFFGGAFLVNSVPHFTNGVSGRPFPTPFASPPGKGLSPSWVNVLWGLFNVSIGYLLVYRVGSFSLRSTSDVVVFGIGVLLMAVMLARAFAPLSAGAK
jgi:hypothetical protein